MLPCLVQRTEWGLLAVFFLQMPLLANATRCCPNWYKGLIGGCWLLSSSVWCKGLSGGYWLFSSPVQAVAVSAAPTASGEGEGSTKAAAAGEKLVAVAPAPGALSSAEEYELTMEHALTITKKEVSRS